MPTLYLSMIFVLFFSVCEQFLFLFAKLCVVGCKLRSRLDFVWLGLHWRGQFPFCFLKWVCCALWPACKRGRGLRMALVLPSDFSVMMSARCLSRPVPSAHLNRFPLFVPLTPVSSSTRTLFWLMDLILALISSFTLLTLLDKLFILRSVSLEICEVFHSSLPFIPSSHPFVSRSHRFFHSTHS